MIITTTHASSRTPAEVWRGITNAEMILPRPLCFKVGIPLPRKCEILAWEDGVATKRRCTSDRGVIEQDITRYAVNEELAFAMAYSHLDVPIRIRHMQDHFRIAVLPDGRTQVVRRTTITIDDRWCGLRTLSVAVGIKAVHRYVFRNIDAA